ncbi:hypothetical protein THTE_3175 [Thermogutta terrifontis]|uniref:Uncharacterized protein n=1 Tax=Thermogutta terrifontis TaxID=1331910 RepID=A0A286RII8_9BACT|nr:hypothetical protein THTE_3175 [Thermogutta terrifontis]
MPRGGGMVDPTSEERAVQRLRPSQGLEGPVPPRSTARW